MAACNGSQIQGSETFEHQDAHGYTCLSEHGDLPRAHVEVPGEILRPNADCGLQGTLAIWNTGQTRFANHAETTRYIDVPVSIAAGCLFRQDVRDRAHIVAREALQEVEVQALGLDLRGASNGHVVVDLRSILQSSNNVRIIRCH